MEAHSAPPHRGCMPWQGLLLTAFITLWQPSRAAPFSVQPVPRVATEGSIVVLQVQNLPPNVFTLRWFKGEETVDRQRIFFYLPKEQYINEGPAFRGQQTLLPDGSLMFQSVSKSDAGFFTLQVIQEDLRWDTVTVSLLVPSLPPSLFYLMVPANVTFELVPPYVFEGEDMLLRVHKLPKDLLAFRWYKGKRINDHNRIFLYLPVTGKSKSEQAYSGRERVYPDGSLLLQNITPDDTGFYTLEMVTRDMASELLSVQIRLSPPWLNSWYRTATGNTTVEIVPPEVIAGRNVLLLVHHLPQDALAFRWFKGQSTIDSQRISFSLPTIGQNEGPAHSGREIVFPNASLLLQNLTLNDTGFYTLQIMRKDYRMDVVSVEISVFREWLGVQFQATFAHVFVETVPPKAIEGKEVLLRVLNLPQNVSAFLWYKGKGVNDDRQIGFCLPAPRICWTGSAYSGRERLFLDGSLLLQNLTVKDTGFYTVKIMQVDERIDVVYVEISVFHSLLALWKIPTPAQFTIEPDLSMNVDTWFPESPQSATESSRLLLLRREIVYPNGTLLLQNPTWEDLGIYTLQTVREDLWCERKSLHVLLYCQRYYSTS
ncbi:cell adhesion molecule CEACAM3-like [Thomomys bottae]